MEKLQKKYAEFQMIEKQLKLVSEQVQDLNGKLMELEYIRNSLMELSEIKEGTEILAPVSSGIFVKAKVQNTDEFLVNVGAGSVVLKNTKHTQELIDEQLADIDKLRVELITNASKLSSQSENIERELKGLVEDVSVSEGQA